MTDVTNMPFVRARRLIKGQGGSTLIELLIAMPLAILLLFSILQSLETAGRDQQDIEGRTEALTNGQLGLERMTRELRQANWVYFRSSAVVDLSVGVRATATGSAADRLVRFDCSTTRCVRSEGPAVAYPPPAAPTFSVSRPVIGDLGNVGDRDGSLTNHDIFRPTHVDTSTGARTADFQSPDYVLVSMQIAFRNRDRNREQGKRTPLVLQDGVSLRNRTVYAG